MNTIIPMRVPVHHCDDLNRLTLNTCQTQAFLHLSFGYARHAQAVKVVGAALIVMLAMVAGGDLHVASAQDWPRFRGPNGTGVSGTPGLPIEFCLDKVSPELPIRFFLQTLATLPDLRPAEQLEADWVEVSGGAILRHCPVCLCDSIVGNGRRSEQAHDEDHDWIPIRRGLCDSVLEDFTIGYAGTQRGRVERVPVTEISA